MIATEYGRSEVFIVCSVTWRDIVVFCTVVKLFGYCQYMKICNPGVHIIFILYVLSLWNEV